MVSVTILVTLVIRVSKSVFSFVEKAKALEAARAAQSSNPKR